ncbi:unnamed protein product [Rotaria sordida]|uniref:HAT C-terminal dimerisation domain-containing protein n=1 Tax=Rotaria sordida TaxID=392033 RepID=A0A814IQU1_9BILA|nr:unnamed protein product [Rotaria sordida]
MASITFRALIILVLIFSIQIYEVQKFDKLIRLYLTITITTATSERAFSALNRVKNTLRSSMTQSRLSHCLLAHIYKEKLDKIDPNQIMSTFISSNEQRQALFGLMF